MTPADIEAEVTRLRAAWVASVAAQPYPADHEVTWRAVAEASLRAREEGAAAMREAAAMAALGVYWEHDFGDPRPDIAAAIRALPLPLPKESP